MGEFHAEQENYLDIQQSTLLGRNSSYSILMVQTHPLWTGASSYALVSRREPYSRRLGSCTDAHTFPVELKKGALFSGWRQRVSRISGASKLKLLTGTAKPDAGRTQNSPAPCTLRPELQGEPRGY